MRTRERKVLSKVMHESLEVKFRKLVKSFSCNETRQYSNIKFRNQQNDTSFEKVQENHIQKVIHTEKFLTIM